MISRVVCVAGVRLHMHLPQGTAPVDLSHLLAYSKKTPNLGTAWGTPTPACSEL